MNVLTDLGKRIAGRVVGATEWNLRRSIRAQGGRLPADPPEVDWMNTVLKSSRQVQEALREVDRCGLVKHTDHAKNWDALAAVGTILRFTTPEARVLDMGARLYSVVLPWLYQYGYRNLTGIDLVHAAPIRRGPIRYEFGDMTKTQYADATFDVICSMSVIEHGVDVPGYFAEAARLLRPGGLLITSTDCWRDHVDTRGQTAYGAPIKIFTMHEIAGMITAAQGCGLRSLRELDLDCDQPAVKWARFGLEFTFVCFTLIRGSHADLPSTGRRELPNNAARASRAHQTLLEDKESR